MLDKVQAQPCPRAARDWRRRSMREWFRELANGGLPEAALGTPWFRPRLFATAAAAVARPDASEDSERAGRVALDRGLAESGALAVIHTTRL
jgi:hypothetical protein